MKLIPARHPHEHHQPVNNRIRFAMTFTKPYLQNYSAANRRVLQYPVLKMAVPFVSEDGTKGTHFIMKPLTILNMF